MLEHSRSVVNQLLFGPSAVSVRDWQALDGALGAWWKDLKDFESDDTFETAFAQKRMTIRGINRVGGVQEFKVSQHSRGTLPHVAGEKQGKVHDQTIRLDTTVEGIRKRMQPDNFEKRTVVVKKYPRTEQHYGKNAMGLHDLSASLLNPLQPWWQQYKLYIESSACFLLMPMPAEADLEIFYSLCDAAKQPGNQDVAGLQQFVVTMKRSLTRIKYAAAEDMHTSFVHYSEGGKIKFRYGESGSWTHPETKKIVKVPPEDIAARRVVARKYTGILKSQQSIGDNDKPVVNEVVVAYRQHGGTRGSRFPMIGALCDIDPLTKRGKGLLLDGGAQKISANGTVEPV